MAIIKYITIDYKNDGLKIEKYILKEFKLYNYTYIQKLIRTGQIRINKKRIKLGYCLNQDDVLRIPIFSKNAENVNNNESVNISNLNNASKLTSKEKIILDKINKSILYENEHFLAINKPKGLAVQGGKGIKTSLDTLLNYIKTNFDIENQNNTTNNENKLKLVHRLDKETSGVLLLAKTNAGAKWLFNQFKEKKIKKTYYCLVQGKVLNNKGTIDEKLLKLNIEANKSIIDNVNGKDSVTDYCVICRSRKNYKTINNSNIQICLLRVNPMTGRNHQIRAHLGIFLKNPILGDGKYGYIDMDLPFNLKKDEIFLHAHSVELKDMNNKTIKILANIDDIWLNAFNTLSFKENHLI